MTANPLRCKRPLNQEQVCGRGDAPTEGEGTMSTVASSGKLFGACVLSGLIGVALTSGAAAQQKAPPPDFSSNRAAWLGGNGGELIEVPGSPRPLRQDPKHPFTPNNAGIGTQPTYRIADLSHPNLKQWVKDAMKKDNDEILAGKIAFTPRSSCKPAGIPAYMLFGGPFFFVQTPKEVRILFEGDQQVRRIHLDVPHSEKPKPTWYGESIGHYEGDTLVVDTIGLSTKSFVDNYRTPHTEKLHVVEHWKKGEDGKTLQVTMTIDDPDTYNRPWQAMRRYRLVQRTMAEQVCAENNQHLFDYNIPTALKSDF
jgi:hypothetical protein